ncbi:cysteine desulfurase family protein [Siphonobacter curvatus]|uniref:Cysteine desulfurase n=1 Tax=Siphonobacter curvatus TaxID=2094562 RepID=A0A2S7IP01_9BACT|nr:cysteine desulfurase family protein [Siphonobacter curvatus]PQA59463.1 cysteine desulfurase [Siphonobacter curvatus]
MKRIYLDNAATTPLDPLVLEEMLPLMREQFGNPSSIHGHGRVVRSAIEKARKKVAELLNTSPSEIFFTSGGTEADNTIIQNTVLAKGIKHIITSKIEHHAVLHTAEELQKRGLANVSFVELDAKGYVDYGHLEELLKTDPTSLISLMHGNNEVGNLLDLDRVGELATAYGALFHSDTVQTMGHYVHDLQRLKTNFIVGAAHKFHGPKGVGFMYLQSGTRIPPFIHGGAQERNMRGGTENVYGIAGLAKALELAYAEMSEHQQHVQGLKSYMIERLKEAIPDVRFNGDPENSAQSLYTVLNVSFPPTADSEMLLFNLDIEGISASGGSACSSGSDVGSHVLTALKADPSRPSARFSFSKYNTREEIDTVVEKLTVIVGVERVS